MISPGASLSAVAIVGPTAVGKSDVADRLAARLSSEVLSCDAMQIYRGMDIGTAKMMPEECSAPLRLIDIVDPGVAYSAALYQSDARAHVERLLGEYFTSEKKRRACVMQIVFALVALVVGFVLLVKGADWFVEGSAGIANKFGIPQIVIGLTIVAMGTSMPEAAVSISAALRGSAEITIGNVVGSNIMNILVILGLTAVVCQIAVQKTTIHYEIPMVIGVTILLAVMGLQNNIISRAEGSITPHFLNNLKR